MRKQTAIVRYSTLWLLLWGVTVGLLFAPATLGEETIVREKVVATGAPGQPPRELTRTTYWGEKKVRVRASSGPDFIFHPDTGRIVEIDHQTKTYSEKTLEELRAKREENAKAGEPMEQQLKMLRQTMGDIASTVTLTEQGEGEVIAGYKTQKYLLSMSPIEYEVWAAPDLAMPRAEEYYEALKVRLVRNPLFEMHKLYDSFKNVKGMFLKSVLKMTLMGITVTTTAEATSVEKGPIPEGQFQAPQDYKKSEP